MLRFLFLLVTICSFSGMAYAQAKTAAPVQPVPEQSSPAAQSEQLSQQVRAEERRLDFQRSGLKYIPWNQAGKKVQDFVIERDNNYKSLIGSGAHVDIAVYDLDADGQPDIVLFPWNHCGFQGCLYKTYFGNINKKPEDYFGWEFIPYKKGVMLDHVYITL